MADEVSDPNVKKALHTNDNTPDSGEASDDFKNTIDSTNTLNKNESIDKDATSEMEPDSQRSKDVNSWSTEVISGDIASTQHYFESKEATPTLINRQEEQKSKKLNSILKAIKPQTQEEPSTTSIPPQHTWKTSEERIIMQNKLDNTHKRQRGGDAEPIQNLR